MELNPKNVLLFEEKSIITASELKQKYSGKLCVCDFYVQNSEKGELKEHGIEYDGILNIDHHAPIPEMMKRITSTSLAIKYVKKHGPLSKDNKIIINHTDCDSILSMSIMNGLIRPENIFEEASISADHTGEENPIADLLQSIQDARSIEFSLKNLFALLKCKNFVCKNFDAKTKSFIEIRKNQRKKIKELIGENKFKFMNDVAYIVLKDKIESELVPAYLPQAKAIMLASPMPNSNWEIKIRLGNKTKGISLNKLGLPNFGGRWNAGSTRRNGGTPIDPEEYVKILISKVK